MISIVVYLPSVLLTAHSPVIQIARTTAVAILLYRGLNYVHYHRHLKHRLNYQLLHGRRPLCHRRRHGHNVLEGVRLGVPQHVAMHVAWQLVQNSLSQEAKDHSLKSEIVVNIVRCIVILIVSRHVVDQAPTFTSHVM